MVKEMFEFSNRVELILANIKTIKKVMDVLKDEYRPDVKRFLQYIDNNLSDEVADIRSWESQFGYDDDDIYFYPKEWKVLNDDEIAICIVLRKDPLKLVPYVGLYIPPEWSKKRIFKDKLIEALTNDFMCDWDEPTDNYPILTNLEYENYAKGDYFDIEGFWKEIIELISKIVKIKPTIDNILNEI